MTTTDTFPGYVAGTWTLDPAHSEVTFSVKHLAISKVRGSFKDFTATLVTAEDPTESTATATIQVGSVDTNQKDRDNHLRTSDFFLVEEYPTMEFVSTGLKTEGTDFTLYGNLTLRGVTKEIHLNGEFGGITTDGYGQTKLGVEANTRINRKDFGVNWNAAIEGGGFTLGDDVTINVELQFVLQAA